MWAVVEIVDREPIIKRVFRGGSTNAEAMEYFRTMRAENRDRYYHMWRVNFVMGYESDLSVFGTIL